MQYIRPLDLSTLKTGSAENWIVRQEEGLGVAIRARRGGAKEMVGSASPAMERLALILSGSAQLVTGSTSQVTVPEGAVAYSPPGSGCYITGTEHTTWLDIEAPVSHTNSNGGSPKVVQVDPARFEGAGFAYQSLLDRKVGCQSLRLNLLKVQPGAGSPDFHIHTFAQLYAILEGEMTLDIGRARYLAKAPTIVCLPPGLVHRNFNASQRVERHVSLLVPEPAEGSIFDYAVNIHEHEAELLTTMPASLSG